jgi:hypothetical protein
MDPNRYAETRHEKILLHQSTNVILQVNGWKNLFPNGAWIAVPAPGDPIHEKA